MLKKNKSNKQNFSEEPFEIMEDADDNSNLDFNLIAEDKSSSSQKQFKKIDKEILDLLNGGEGDSNYGEELSDNSSEFVTITGNAPDDNFVIIENNTSISIKILKIVKFILGMTGLAIISLVLLFSTLFKIIPENINGSSYKIKNYSVISKNYQPNLDELRVGDTIFIDKTQEWCPYIYEYEKLIYESRYGAIIYCENKNGETVRIQSVDIDYIAKPIEESDSNSTAVE